MWGLQPWEGPGLSGPSVSQGARALASTMTSNLNVKRLDLWDNGLCGASTEALAGALSQSSSIYVHILKNQLGAVTTQGVFATLVVNLVMQRPNIFLRVLDISNNGFGDPGASVVGEALQTNNILEELNMSNSRISADVQVSREFDNLTAQ
ncbi:hypothetical protein HPG69_015237 [Diceros bicornis minor]|uniref:Uncharacterized protein n=1 Tax=Diceros bicornis minor TaxID=77932 RepID=A0A7J7EIV3_DICBM|nr:hypothetical protein HPG69_015237 [Diceros bicornis minor]